ncbi:MAG: hypothetical protein QOJ54_3576 [Aliidongia sp.]|nr:hypothetical protein [Aliidongia sp.]
MRIHRLLPASALIGLLAGCTVPQPHSAGPDAGVVQNTPLALAVTTEPATPPAPPPAFSATSVGARAAQLDKEVDQLDVHAGLCGVTASDIKAQRTELSTDYFTRIAQINARLQAGTTAGNPELTSAWQAARGSLGGLDREAARLTDLVTNCTDDDAQATYLTQSIRAAMSLRGAVDADHAELIKQSGRVAAIASNLELTLGLMLDDLNRQNEMLLVEHRNLTTVAHAIDVGQLLGGNLALKTGTLPSWTTPTPAPMPPHHRPTALSDNAHSAPAQPAKVDAAHAAGTPSDTVLSTKARKHHHRPVPNNTATPTKIFFHHHKPLIVVPLTADASYERALYSAVSSVLSKQPGARFVVEASVQHNPSHTRAVLDAGAAQRQADAVVRSLTAFGLPQTRVVTMNTVTGTDGAIRVYAQ